MKHGGKGITDLSLTFCFLQDLNTVAFRFKDKERPRGYTSKVAGLLHVGVSLMKDFKRLSPWLQVLVSSGCCSVFYQEIIASVSSILCLVWNISVLNTIQHTVLCPFKKWCVEQYTSIHKLNLLKFNHPVFVYDAEITFMCVSTIRWRKS